MYVVVYMNVSYKKRARIPREKKKAFIWQLLTRKTTHANGLIKFRVAPCKFSRVTSQLFLVLPSTSALFL